MYNVGDVVVHLMFGICRITAIEKRDFSGDEQEYYVLSRIRTNKNNLYVPTDNALAAQKIHKVCTREEADALISGMEFNEMEWIENDEVRREEYGKILKRSDRYEIILLIKSLYLHQKELSGKRKKLDRFDVKALKLAEKKLYEELAYALEIEQSEVAEYITSRIV